MNNHAETTAVKKVIEAYMTGTYRADVPMLESVFHPRAVMNGYLGPDKILGTPALFIQDMASAPSMEANGDSYQYCHRHRLGKRLPRLRLLGGSLPPDQGGRQLAYHLQTLYHGLRRAVTYHCTFPSRKHSCAEPDC